LGKSFQTSINFIMAMSERNKYDGDNTQMTELGLYMDFVPNRVLGASPPDISPLESLLPRSVRTTLAQLHSGHCRLLNSYKAHITSGVSDVCPECGVAPHSVEHLFNCQSHPTQLTVQTCGTTRLRSQTSSTWTTDDRRRAAGLSQQQQLYMEYEQI